MRTSRLAVPAVPVSLWWPFGNLSAVDFDLLGLVAVSDPDLPTVGMTLGVAVVDVPARVGM